MVTITGKGISLGISTLLATFEPGSSCPATPSGNSALAASYFQVPPMSVTATDDPFGAESAYITVTTDTTGLVLPTPANDAFSLCVQFLFATPVYLPATNPVPTSSQIQVGVCGGKFMWRGPSAPD